MAVKLVLAPLRTAAMGGLRKKRKFRTDAEKTDDSAMIGPVVNEPIAAFERWPMKPIAITPKNDAARRPAIFNGAGSSFRFGPSRCARQNARKMARGTGTARPAKRRGISSQAFLEITNSWSNRIKQMPINPRARPERATDLLLGFIGGVYSCC